MCVAVLLVGASLANVDLNALAAPAKSARDAAAAATRAQRSVWGAVYAVRGIISGFVIVRLLLVPAVVGALEALATAIIPIRKRASAAPCCSSRRACRRHRS